MDDQIPDLTSSQADARTRHPAFRRRLAIVGVTAGLAAGGLLGATLGTPSISGAQESETPTTEAPADPSTAPEERPDPSERLAEILQPLVDDGTLTVEQRDAVVAALVEAGPPAGPHGPGHHGRGPGLDAAAEALGLSAEELRAELEDGSSLADVAAERGVDVQVVIDAMVADLQAHLDEEVAAGELTQEEADEKLANATERITALVNGEVDGPPFGLGPRGHGPGGPFGPPPTEN